MYVLILGELISFYHLGTLDQLAIIDRNVLLFDSRPVFLPQQVKGNVFSCHRCRIKLDGNGDQSERNDQ